MKAFLIGGAIAALTAGVATAQPAPPPPPGVAQGTVPAPLPPRAPDVMRNVHVQVMSDKVMTRDEVVAHVRKMFERLDANRDGYVTREEANAMFAGLDGLSERMEAVRHQMDGVREHMQNMRFNVKDRVED